MKSKFWITVAVLVDITIASGLLLAFPVQMSVMGGLMIHYLQTLGEPAGTIATELNPSYTGTVVAAPGSSMATTSPANGTLLMPALITVVGTGGSDSWDRTVLGLSTSPRPPAGAIAATTLAVAEGRLALAAVVLYVLVVTVVTVPYVLCSKKQLVAAR